MGRTSGAEVGRARFRGLIVIAWARTWRVCGAVVFVIVHCQARPATHGPRERVRGDRSPAAAVRADRTPPQAILALAEVDELGPPSPAERRSHWPTPWR